MNSLKLIVNSWDALYPPIGRRGNDNTAENGDEDTSLSEKERIQQQIDLDSQLRTSIDQEPAPAGTDSSSTATLASDSTPDKVASEKVRDEYEDEDYEVEDNTLTADNGSQSTLSSVFSYLFFFPNYLVIKPLTFVWLLVTYPFTNFFHPTQGNASGASSAIESASTGPSKPRTPTSKPSVEDGDDDETPAPQSPSDRDQKIELMKQENLISNTIKSPSASSKYLIPPPQRLFPLSRNPQRRKKRKTLILDLDETLIHSLSRGSPRSFSPSGSSNMIEIKLNNIASLYYVYKRPYCDYFLKEAAKWFELQIFTASVKEYADPIINWLESEITPYVQQQQNKDATAEKQHLYTPRKSIFTKRYYRTDCTYRPGVGYIKDLSKFFPREDDLKNVIILDNSPVSYALHEDNAVMIEGWINDQGDRDLLNLLPMLHSLSLCIDVRYILGLRGGEKVFEN